MFRYFTEALLTFFFYQLCFLCRFLPHIDKSVSVSICSLEYEYGSRQYKSTKPLLYAKKYVITVRNEVAKVMFLQACVCPQGRSDLVPGRGGEGVCSRGVSAPEGVCSAGAVCSGGCLLCTEVAPPPPGRDDYCCGRYASYWNAFLYSFTLEATCDKNTGKYRQAHTVFPSQSIDFLHRMRKRNDGARYPGKTYIVSKITMVLLYLHGTQL